MKLDPDERIFLTTEEIRRIEEICDEPAPEMSEHMLAVIKRYKERFKNETKT